MTQAEFHELPEGPPYLEFEEGELIPMPRPHGRHQDIVAALVSVVPAYVARNQLGKFWVEIEVDLTEELTYVPDLAFLTTEHRAR
jgi:Uma2 family endonuclease